MTMWFCFLMMYGVGGYSAYPVPSPTGFAFASEAECREAGKQTGYAEMPPLTAPMNTWPNKAWLCKTH